MSCCRNSASAAASGVPGRSRFQSCSIEGTLPLVELGITEAVGGGAEGVVCVVPLPAGVARAGTIATGSDVRGEGQPTQIASAPAKTAIAHRIQTAARVFTRASTYGR